jgi:hypothetical protein
VSCQYCPKIGRFSPFKIKIPIANPRVFRGKTKISNSPVAHFPKGEPKELALSTQREKVSSIFKMIVGKRKYFRAFCGAKGWFWRKKEKAPRKEAL